MTTNNLLNLPNEILENIFSYTSYDEVSNGRLICRSIDKVCCQLLNHGFSRVDKIHALIQKEVKSKLPRRESERRNHPLARHVDILAAVETRLSLLSMTYMKFIDLGLCCFIPGKVLDEVLRVLHIVKSSTAPPRAHELLQELRDISSMAMEHFDEKIVPVLKSKVPSSQSVMSGFSSSSTSFSPSGTYSLSLANPPPPQVRPPAVRQEIYQLRHNQRTASTAMVGLRKDMAENRSHFVDHKRKLYEQDKKIADLNRVILELKKKVADQEHCFKDLHNKMLEMSHKLGTICESSSVVVAGKEEESLVDQRDIPEVMPVPSCSSCSLQHAAMVNKELLKPDEGKSSPTAKRKNEDKFKSGRLRGSLAKGKKNMADTNRDCGKKPDKFKYDVNVINRKRKIGKQSSCEDNTRLDSEEYPQSSKRNRCHGKGLLSLTEKFIDI